MNLFNYAQKNQFAIPAINVTSSSTVVAALEAARDNKSPIILQTSQGGAAYFAGKVRFLQKLSHMIADEYQRVLATRTKKHQLLVPWPQLTTFDPLHLSTESQSSYTLIIALRSCCHGSMA